MKCTLKTLRDISGILCIQKTKISVKVFFVKRENYLFRIMIFF